MRLCCGLCGKWNPLFAGPDARESGGARHECRRRTPGESLCGHDWYISGHSLGGNCHAQFGSYGPQDGDGIPTISGEEQIRQTAEAIAAFAVQ